MKSFKIFYKCYKENKKFDFITRLYLANNYVSNLHTIKRDNGLRIYDLILNFRFQNSFTNKNKQKEEVINKSSDTLPNFENELNEIKTNITNKKIAKIKNVMLRILKILNIKNLFDLKNSQDNIKKFFSFLSFHIGIYKKSLQELVEGQREVTQNKEFTFEDGESVQEKMDKFELKIKEHLNVNNLKGNLKKFTNEKKI